VRNALDAAADFCRSFWRAMGDREIHLQAYRELAITLAVVSYFVVVAAVADRLNS
jgi:hypothetical protein